MLLLLFPLGSLIAQEGITITGVVTDGESQTPLPGVSVVEKGTNNGTATDFDGNYSLELSNANAVLQVSFMGYETQEIEVGGQTEIDITLSPDMGGLDEVVVIGYGTMKKSNVTGSIVSVDQQELTQVPSTNVMESLQGKLPGVDITRSSGQAGAGINIAVRGNRSLTASNSPLFIVDGIQYSNIQDLNPNDIESMEVLKDAASTAIYGSRGANGVIIITTKQGRQGETRVTFNAYAGVSEVTNYPEVQTPMEYANLRREARRATGDWNSPEDDPSIFNDWELDAVNNNGGTVWPDLFLSKGAQQDYQAGVSTATENSRFYVSLNYFNEQGNQRMDELNRYSLRANIDHDINDKITIGTQNQVTYYDQNFHRDPMNIANKINPLLTPYDDEGNVEFQPNNWKDVNPLIDEEPGHYENNNRTTRVFTSAYFDYDILEDLNFRTNLGVTLQNSRTGIYRASETVDRAGQASEAVYQTGNDVGINWENIINYDTEFGGGDHSLTLTGIQSYLSGQNEAQSARGRNQLLDYQLFHSLGNASEQLAIQSNYEETSLLSFTGRVHYSYKDKYIFMATGRGDGASQLSDGNKWAFFPSISGAWRLIEEDFMADTETFTDLKIRASYGVAGNAAVQAYSTQSLLNRIPFGFNEEPAIGYTFGSRIGNTNLGWEISKTYNIGVDFGLLRNRITGTIDVYDTRTDDLLMDRFLPPTSGVRSITENIGATRNRGIEISLNTTPVQQGIVEWNVGLNWFRNKEEIVELATGSNDIANGWFIGEPTQAFYDYEKDGIWQLGQEAEAESYGQEPGEIRVVDQNNDGEIDSNNDRIVLGSPRPDWSGNLTSDLTVGNFDLNIQVFARVGQMMEYEFYDIYDPSGNENSHRHDYWTPENPTNAYPRPNAGRTQGSTQYYSSILYEDASFLKLRNVTLGYTIPKSFLDRVGISKLRVYATGRNLWVKSEVDNYDPERGGAMSNPIPRLLVGGINLEL
ncbi:SusC/RagA family TonB-linked outer membrane protein [Salegentibacter salinarum]|uniref:SusC/RagA family TonB-linked outer membrane protein n=2 Tax=Salegentibacter salinarum TaxID=447422 RepID=A0A2N0TNY5_9FLAO|nr:SusC/RagA family TonB-linked outer membrane protein [Salegentibacter salinarum]SKB64113.1 TonB-linked outer membrane protein, SusC/RagA family [Salegentibacter salinarum]